MTRILNLCRRTRATTAFLSPTPIAASPGIVTGGHRRPVTRTEIAALFAADLDLATRLR